MTENPTSDPQAVPATADPRAEVFESHRGRLLGLAYRLLGTWGEAEDLVQETWLRWHAADTESIDSAAAWLTTVATRLGIDHLRRVRSRREEYVGPWLPEPVALELAGRGRGLGGLGTGSSAEEGPEAQAELGEALSLALLRVLEELSPAERAAFLLRQVFDYDYAELAAILERSEASCRQLVHRAKGRVAEGRTRFSTSAASQQELLQRFLLAANQGEIDPLVSLLSEEAILYSDGGGKVAAALNPIYGADRIARFMLGVASKQPDDLEVELRELVGQPAAVGWSGGRPVFAMTLELAEGDGGAAQIVAVQIVRNPDKLGAIPPVH